MVFSRRFFDRTNPKPLAENMQSQRAGFGLLRRNDRNRHADVDRM